MPQIANGHQLNILSQHYSKGIKLLYEACRVTQTGIFPEDLFSAQVTGSDCSNPWPQIPCQALQQISEALAPEFLALGFEIRTPPGEWGPTGGQVPSTEPFRNSSLLSQMGVWLRLAQTQHSLDLLWDPDISVQSSWVITASLPGGNVCVLHILSFFHPGQNQVSLFSSFPCSFPFMDFSSPTLSLLVVNAAQSIQVGEVVVGL